METPREFRFLPLVVVAGCGVLVGLALFGPEEWSWRNARAACITGPTSSPRSETLRAYACPQCGLSSAWGNDVCPQCGWVQARAVKPEFEVEPLLRNAAPAANAGAPVAAPGAPAAPEAEIELNAGQNAPPVTGSAPAANTIPAAAAPIGSMTPVAAVAAASTGLPSPREQNAAGKEFIEGHWLGLEVIPLTPELAKEYLVPPGEKGILVDEITLEAAESGILAGDMVQSVEGRPTPDLKAFFLATQRVQEKERADVGISRRGQAMTFFMEARNTKTLGFSQMEAAQPIKPGSISPHRARSNACTACHIIMETGGQLPTDAGDILPNPPAITRAARATHGDRGQCATCHVIK